MSSFTDDFEFGGTQIAKGWEPLSWMIWKNGMLNCCILVINLKKFNNKILFSFKHFSKQTNVESIVCLLITVSLTNLILVWGLETW